MIRALKALYAREQFHPSVLGLFVNPFYFARRGLLEGVRSCADGVGGRVLDVGCGQKPYEGLFRCREYVGLEIDSPENRARKKADAFYDGKRFPFPDGGFDAVVVNEVLEHVFDPDGFLSEVRRVLKDGGALLATVPFVWDEHEQPVDYARYSSFGLKHLLSRHGFRTVRHTKTAADARVLFQMAAAYVQKAAAARNPYVNLLSTFFLIAPINVLGALLWRILPANGDLYLDNVILAKKGERP